MKIDYKKEYKDLYQPGRKPTIIDVPEMTFIMVDGKGDPNTSAEYKQAMELLYGLSFTIKMSKMSGNMLEGYFEYVVPPLEGLWTIGEASTDFSIENKDEFCWTSMIRQPEFVTPEIFEWAKETFLKKHPEADIAKARFETYKEGVCCQIMHIGCYDNEPETVELMHRFMEEEGWELDMPARRHHEIYLSDPRRCAAEKLKTVIRLPIKKAK